MDQFSSPSPASTQTFADFQSEQSDRNYPSRVSSHLPPTYPLSEGPLPYIFDGNDIQVSIHPLSTPIHDTLAESVEKVAEAAAAESPELSGCTAAVKRHTRSHSDDEDMLQYKKPRLETQTQTPAQAQGLGEMSLLSPSESPVHSSVESDIESVDVLEQFQTLMDRKASESGGFARLSVAQRVAAKLSRNSRTALMYALLQNMDRRTLSTLVNHMTSALRFDLVSNLPREILLKVLLHLDHKSILNMMLTCKRWRAIVNCEEEIWLSLLRKENLMLDTSPENVAKQLADPELVREFAGATPMMPSLDAITQQCHRQNLARLLYKKQYIINQHWIDPNFEPKRISIEAHGAKVITCLQFDANRIVSGADEVSMNIFDTETGEPIRTLEGHTGGVWGLKYVGNTLVSAATDKSLRVWNMATGKCTHILKTHSSTVRCLDIIEPVVVGKDDYGNEIVFPKRPILVSGSRDCNLNLWDLSMVKDDEVMNKKFGLKYTEEEMFEYYEEKRNSGDEPQELYADSKYFLGCLQGHSASVRTLSVYGKTIVSGSYDMTVRVWDAERKVCLHKLVGHTSKIYSTALDPVRKKIFSGSMDSNVIVWDMISGKKLRVLKDHTSLVGLVQLSKHNLVTSAADGYIRVWDPDTLQLKRALFTNNEGISTCQNDDKRIVSGSGQKMSLWDISTGKLVRELITDASSVWQVKFDDKRCVAAVQRDGKSWIEILNFE